MICILKNYGGNVMELLYMIWILTIILGVLFCIYDNQYKRLCDLLEKKGQLDYDALEYRVNKKLWKICDILMSYLKLE